MTLIDGDRIITAQLYDDQYEEFTEKKMSIIDYINAYTDEGATIADDVLDKIRAEIEKDAFNDVNGSKYIFVKRVNQIIDKYKSEGSEKE